MHKLSIFCFLLVTLSLEAATQATLVSKAQPGLSTQVTFSEISNGVKVLIHATGLSPKAVHAIHIHEKGLCEAPKFESAGDHFNPGHKNHGGPDSPNRHIGDLGNITANDKGVAHKEIELKGIDKSQFESIIGKAVVLHAKADDLKTQPSGDSGDRIACGIISN